MLLFCFSFALVGFSLYSRFEDCNSTSVVAPSTLLTLGTWGNEKHIPSSVKSALGSLALRLVVLVGARQFSLELRDGNSIVQHFTFDSPLSAAAMDLGSSSNLLTSTSNSNANTTGRVFYDFRNEVPMGVTRVSQVESGSDKNGMPKTPSLSICRCFFIELSSSFGCFLIRNHVDKRLPQSLSGRSNTWFADFVHDPHGGHVRLHKSATFHCAMANFRKRFLSSPSLFETRRCYRWLWNLCQFVCQAKTCCYTKEVASFRFCLLIQLFLMSPSFDFACLCRHLLSFCVDGSIGLMNCYIDGVLSTSVQAENIKATHNNKRFVLQVRLLILFLLFVLIFFVLVFFCRTNSLCLPLPT
jgi:hypothetical protein